MRSREAFDRLTRTNQILRLWYRQKTWDNPIGLLTQSHISRHNKFLSMMSEILRKWVEIFVQRMFELRNHYVNSFFAERYHLKNYDTFSVSIFSALFLDSFREEDKQTEKACGCW